MRILVKFIALIAIVASQTSAADVDVRLSTREAYVGAPITLQIAIINAGDYESPRLPEIDGCDVRSAGSPSQSSQITIINGRRSESRSVKLQYLITPRRAGRFEVPALEISVDGSTVKTEPLSFVATKSETGDLLFAEIEGEQAKVYVGQPLELKLKIWIKPFRDAEHRLTLAEGDMWQMIAQSSSSWGSFTSRMEELRQNRQRPGGQEVLRDDGQGNERSYYLYEITATVYPDRPGRIAADDVQIVANYPTGLKTSRSPFGSLFDDGPFGGRSPLSDMLDDDFFGSPFRDQLSIASARPVVAEVKVDSIEVVPVPTEGRPSNYRGAVGSYRIVTEATPTTVEAGDPITLHIGIAGTGPMNLVQCRRWPHRPS
ncbi:MAG: BatD family protein [Pirellulaceae bacterium]